MAANVQLSGLTDGLTVQILLDPADPDVVTLAAIAAVDRLIEGWVSGLE